MGLSRSLIFISVLGVAYGAAHGIPRAFAEAATSGIIIPGATMGKAESPPKTSSKPAPKDLRRQRKFDADFHDYRPLGSEEFWKDLGSGGPGSKASKSIVSSRGDFDFLSRQDGVSPGLAPSYFDKFGKPTLKFQSSASDGKVWLYCSAPRPLDVAGNGQPATGLAPQALCGSWTRRW